jgi:hypothetical protein
MSSSMRLAINAAAAGSRAGAAVSRDFAGLVFACLSGFAAIDALFTTLVPSGETSDCDDNIENYIVNNF